MGAGRCLCGSCSVVCTLQGRGRCLRGGCSVVCTLQGCGRCLCGGCSVVCTLQGRGRCLRGGCSVVCTLQGRGRCLCGSCSVACTLQRQALADKTIAADALPVGMERFQQSFGHKPFHQVPRPPFADLQMAAHINGVHRAVFPKREPYYFAFKQLIGAHLCQGAGNAERPDLAEKLLQHLLACPGLVADQIIGEAKNVPSIDDQMILPHQSIIKLPSRQV
ncbi:Protein of unknown function [Thermobacillus xylanilyticus]|uniref:Uncharacterized protein n=1 Tax=Thermobacillus xylanilyticus TaxID=76633 RepID=A0ABM8V6Z8_THEXY|nr:Protein of unknown function [Thermobacillus xylanilyticus]